MTDFTVVVVLSFIVVWRIPKRSADENRWFADRETPKRSRNHVLMFVVRKLDQKLFRRNRIAKRKTRVVAGRDSRMASRANYRLRSLEKLLAMTADAGVVSGEVGHVGEVSYFFPVAGRDFVASVAGAAMFSGEV